LRDCPLSKMTQIKEGLGKNIKVVSGGEDMTRRSNAGNGRFDNRSALVSIRATYEQGFVDEYGVACEGLFYFTAKVINGDQQIAEKVKTMTAKEVVREAWGLNRFEKAINAEIVRETEKAVLVTFKTHEGTETRWIPKKVILDQEVNRGICEFLFHRAWRLKIGGYTGEMDKKTLRHTARKNLKGVKFYMLKVIKKDLQQDFKCAICGKGKVWFKTVTSNKNGKKYTLALWKEIKDAGKEIICPNCEKTTHTLRNSTVKAEVPDYLARRELNKTMEGLVTQWICKQLHHTPEMPMKQVIDRELHHEPRFTPFETEDLNYMLAIDNNASKSFIGWGKCDWSKNPDKQYSYGMEGEN